MAKTNLNYMKQIAKVNELGLEYQTAPTKRRNKIIKLLVEAFKTKVLSEISNEGKLIEEECLSKLYEMTWKSLEDFDVDNKHGASFFTHLYGRLKWVAPRSRSKIINNMWYKTTTSLDIVFEYE